MDLMRSTRILFAFSFAACSGSSSGPQASFAVPGGPHPPVDFYDLPFPNDLRLTVDGHPDFSTFPTPNALVNDYTAAMMTGLDGFGLNAAITARFEEPIDPATMPQTATDSLADGASVYLVDIDPASPDVGKKWPVRMRFEPRKGQLIGTNWMSALPYPGFPLDEGTTYALVITDRLHSADGSPLAAADDFAAIAATSAPGDAALAAAQTTYAKLFAYLDQPGGDERGDVVSAAVFTTQRATDIMPALRKKVWTMAQPVASGLARHGVTADYVEYEGTYPGPNFQRGDVPYSAGGGDIVLDGDGLPIVQRMEDLRVSFAVPTTGKAPWPIVLYAHGTGGNFLSYLNDGTAARLAQQGLAVISIDQVLHGPRNPGGNPDVDFFNFQNPQAARYNAIQGAADDFTLLRLAQGIDFTDAANSNHITFDSTKIYFFGHSQGGLTGPPFLAAEPLVKGAVLSGAGALLYQALLTKTEPFDIASIVGTLVRDPNLDINDPVLALLQTWVERSDAANYGPLLARAPLADPDATGTTPMAPKPIFQSEGFTDHYAPNPTIEGFATSIGGDQVAPVKTTVDGLVLRGRQTLAAPMSNNLDGVTVVLLQYDAAANSDGHFVVFDVPAAQQQSAQFLGTLATTGTATIVQAQ